MLRGISLFLCAVLLAESALWRPLAAFADEGLSLPQSAITPNAWSDPAVKELDAPPRVRLADIDNAIARGRAYLVDKGTDFGNGTYWSGMTYQHLQNRNGFVAITALVAEALRDSPVAAERAAAVKAERYVHARAAVDFARPEGGSLFSPYRMAYGMMELLEQKQTPERDAQVTTILEEIRQMATKNAGFRYAYGECSGSASSNFQLALLALAVSKAKQAGFQAKGLDLELANRMGKANGYYATSKSAGGLNKAARSPLCELARLEAGCEGAGKEAIQTASDNFFANERGLLETQKWEGQTWPVQNCKGKTVNSPHNPGKESVTSYFLLFGLYWLSASLEKLPPLEAEDEFHRVGAMLVYLQRPDDSWLGSPVYAGKSYGTASAVATLLRVKRGLERARVAREARR